MNILPSKKILSLLILIIAVVASAMILFGNDTAESAVNTVGNLVSGEKITIPVNPDWEKELTLINQVKTASTTKINDEDSSLTSVVSRSILANYLSLTESGNLSQTDAQELVENTIDYIDARQKNYTDIKLKIVPDSGMQSIKAYGETIGSVLKKYKENETNELKIYEEALSSRNPNKLTELERAVTVYEALYYELLLIPVPQSFVKAHTGMVVGLASTIDGLRNMKQTFSDPLLGLQGLQTFQSGVTTFVDALQATSLFIIKNNVSYEQGSGGYYLLNGI